MDVPGGQQTSQFNNAGPGPVRKSGTIDYHIEQSPDNDRLSAASKVRSQVTHLTPSRDLVHTNGRKQLATPGPSRSVQSEVESPAGTPENPYPDTINDLNKSEYPGVELSHVEYLAVFRPPMHFRNSPSMSASFDKEDSQIEASPSLQSFSCSLKLDSILTASGNGSARKTFASHGISDLWLPLSKQMLRRFFPDPRHMKAFLEFQEASLGTDSLDWANHDSTHSFPTLHPQHSALEDDGDIIVESRVLGEGAVGIVEEVTVLPHRQPRICVRKRIGRSKQLKAQQQIMAAFAREIRVMRLVDHRHCVRLVGSYTDLDTVNILSTPVADMDLATMLDQSIESRQWNILYRGLDCLCNAMLYLHGQKIRHEDLKPQNVLIHGENILLTDFGFSFDFSDESASTTTGRPSAWTIRYSPPEVLDFQPRNRASDIFSLGCVLVEMISGLYWQSLSTVKEHWKQTGNGQSSFARNPEATTSWLASLPNHPDTKRLRPIIDFIPTMLDPDRHRRPTAQQIVHHLENLSLLVPDAPQHINMCCGTSLNWGHISGCFRTRTSKPPVCCDPEYWPEIARYFDPASDEDLGFVVLDPHHNPVASKPDYFYCIWDNHRRTLGEFPYIKSFTTVQEACNMLYRVSPRTRPAEEWSQARAQQSDFHKGLNRDEVLQHILKLHTTGQMIFTARSGSVWLPEARDGDLLSPGPSLSPPVFRQRTIQVAMVGINLKRSKSPYYDAVFYVLTFRLSAEGYDPKKINASFVDLTTEI